MDNILNYILLVPILLVSLSFHEAAHAYAAYYLGDNTAKERGRLSLNPLKHLDLVGFIFFIVFKFGWAKPVPINPYNFKNFKLGTAITAAAGPFANFLLATLAALFYRVLPFLWQMGLISYLLQSVLYMTVVYNLFLGIFNLIPFPPLDGSKILGGFLSDRLYAIYTAQEKIGMFIFIGVLLISNFFKLNFISALLMPPVNFMLKVLLVN